MARVKRAVNAHKKRRVVLERASGYRGQRSRLYRKAKEQVTHSLVYAYRDRKKRKGDFRQLWIQRINAAARQNGMTYNRFIQGLKVPVSRWTAGCSPTWRSTTPRRSPPWSRSPRAPSGRRQRSQVIEGRDSRLTTRQHPATSRTTTKPPVPLGPELTSIRSGRVQAARRLTKRAFRARESRFLAEGRRRCARR